MFSVGVAGHRKRTMNRTSRAPIRHEALLEKSHGGLPKVPEKRIKRCYNKYIVSGLSEEALHCCRSLTNGSKHNGIEEDGDTGTKLKASDRHYEAAVADQIEIWFIPSRNERFNLKRMKALSWTSTFSSREIGIIVSHEGAAMTATVLDPRGSGCRSRMREFEHCPLRRSVSAFRLLF